MSKSRGNTFKKRENNNYFKIIDSDVICPDNEYLASFILKGEKWHFKVFQRCGTDVLLKSKRKRAIGY